MVKFNIANPATALQKVVDTDDEKILRAFYDKRISAEVEGEVLGDEFKGYVFRISGGNDKQGFPMKQGVLSATRVRLLLHKGLSCYRPRRTGERKRKSVRGCIVGPVIYLLLIALLPSPARVAFYAMPLLGLNACALPFFRACFSKARPLERQGETLMLVAALESVGSMVAAPLAALGFALLLHTPRLVFVFGAVLVVVAMFAVVVIAVVTNRTGKR